MIFIKLFRQFGRAQSCFFDSKFLQACSFLIGVQIGLLRRLLDLNLKKNKNNDVSIFFSTDVVSLLNMDIVTCNLYYLGFVWVLEGFRILSFRKFINFFFAKTVNSRSSYIFVKRHKTPWPLWRGGIFSHFEKDFLGFQ